MKRCQYCKKKLSLILYSCRCSYIKLCSNCRLPEQHDCQYDYKEAGKKNIIQENSKIISSKFIII